MKSKEFSQTLRERYHQIEPLESRIAPAAAVASGGLLDKAVGVTAVAGGALVVTAGEVLTTAANGGGSYLLYVEQGAVLVHTTDFNHDGQLESNEITGLSVANGTRVDVFVDIHGDVITNLNPDHTLTDSDNNAANGRDGRVLLDANIAAINLRSLQASDFSATGGETSAQIVNAHLAPSNYSIFGNIYAGNGVGLSGDSTSGLHINTAGGVLQAAKFNGAAGQDLYVASQPTIGSILVGTAATGQSFTLGSDGAVTPGGVPQDIYGTIVPFNPAPGETGASVYNIASNSAFNIGTVQAGNGGFNAGGGSLVNFAYHGNAGGGYALIAGDAGVGTSGHAGGAITNFSETGTFTGSVLLHSGNGGAALTGAGGNAGSISFSKTAPVAINAHFVMQYGNGGDGYTAGGNGTSLSSGTFVTAEGKVTNATNLVATMHTIGSIGTTQSFDFNGDGFADAVYSTENPNLLAVVFGTSVGGFNEFSTSKTIYLSGPSNVSSIVVADLNGDGHPDIAVTSSDASQMGVELFFSEYNAQGALAGFSPASFVTLPSLSAVTPPLFTGGYYGGPVPVFKVVAGDFNGDGNMDLAVAAQETAISADHTLNTVLIYLNGDGHGHFFADFSNSHTPFQALDNKGASAVILKPTALAQFTPGSGHDVIIEAIKGDKAATVYDFSGASPLPAGTISFGKVDTNRDVGSMHISSTDFTVQDLTVIQDPTDMTKASVVALSQAPVGFLVTEQGDGTGGFTVQSVGVGGGDQAGIKIGDENSHPVAIVTVPNTGGTAYSSVAVLDYRTSTDTQDSVLVVDFPTDLSTGTQAAAIGLPTPTVQNNTVIAFDTYNPLISTGLSQYGFIEGQPLQTYDSGQQRFAVVQPGATFGFESFAFKDSGYFITSGSGGNSLDGNGGQGGTIGQALTVTTTNGVVTATGSLNIVFPADPSFEGTAFLTAGSGGNGLKNGGSGGDILGLSVQYAKFTPELTALVSLTGGDGGMGLRGSGGSGGSVGQMFIESGFAFAGGDGGSGVIGGNGGSVTGSKIPGLAVVAGNVENQDVVAQGGDGGTGLTQGGNGGNVDTFKVHFEGFTTGIGGSLAYYGGNAGDAVGGKAGAGGSVLDSSPLNASAGTNGGDNNLAGPIVLEGGAGGTGLTGGRGGAITNFINSASNGNNPTTLTVIAGPGGGGTTGNGGAGGAITNFSSSSIGSTGADYDRVVAGSGGDSVGATGGAGGVVSSINTSASSADAPFFVAAGEGGNGVKAGGTGGSVLSSTVNAGAGAGKVVIVAGDGGTSFGVAPIDPTNAASVAQAVGGVNGPGGAGGSIVNFTQPASVSTRVDLIAGNGGATVAHSVANGNLAKDNSGVGGSITNIHIAGTIGNVNDGVAIKSYNDFFKGQTMQQFIDNYVLGGLGPLDDTVGNVGLVAGAAGRVLGGLPSNNGINGSVTTIRATQIMSMVAGSVDQVDFIQKLSDYKVTINGGDLGTDKSVVNPDLATGFPGNTYTAALNSYDYVNAAGVEHTGANPGSAAGFAGGVLIDGAIVAKNVRIPQSTRDYSGTS